MPVCPGIKRDGTRCTVVVGGSQRYCYQHDPDRSEERRRAASRAGKSKPSREIGAIKRQLQKMADDVLVGTLDRADAAVSGQLLNILLRAVEQERKIKEQDVLEERLEALEQAHVGGGQRWRA